MKIAIVIAICWVAFCLGLFLVSVGIQLGDLLDSKSRWYMSKTRLFDKRLDSAKCDKCGR